MKKSIPEKLTRKQKEAIAEQLAGFFFGLWTTRNTNENLVKARKKESVRIPQKD